MFNTVGRLNSTCFKVCRRLHYILPRKLSKGFVMEKMTSPLDQANVRTLRSSSSVKTKDSEREEIKDSATGSKYSKMKNKKQLPKTSSPTNIKQGNANKNFPVKQEAEIGMTIKAEVCNYDDETKFPSSFNSNQPLPKAPLKDVSPKKRRHVKTENDIVKKEKVVKEEKMDALVRDIEDVAWVPENWQEVLDNILKMRKLHVAPVDSLGCEKCPDADAQPEVFRYQTLISVMLSSQTRDEVTYAATQRLISHGLTVDSILKMPDEKIGELIYPAGFWKSKVKYIRNTTQILKDQYNGDIPRNFKDLCKLPGVGPKMANIVMSVAWNDTVGIAVDTHVHRISNRLGWVKKPTKVPEQTRKALESWLPKSLWENTSLNLVGFGQTICKPIKPRCQDCLNVKLCPSAKVN